MARTAFAETAFLLMDADGSGEIDFKEFVCSLWNYCSFDEIGLFKFAFSLYDSDQSMYLEKAEIRQIVNQVYGKGASTGVGDLIEQRVEALVEKIDKNGVSRVRVRAFKRAPSPAARPAARPPVSCRLPTLRPARRFRFLLCCALSAHDHHAAMALRRPPN
jgi:Ca2+-binding EF-hand superfamily protein